MLVEAYKSILYSDTLVPDIFISEYLPSMDGDFVKIYLHCLFLYKYNKRINIDEAAKKLELSIDRVKECFAYLESIEVILKKENAYILNDLKEKQINKMFRPKSTSTPEEAIKGSEIHKQRSQIITSINNKFYSGLMPPSLYTDIDAWFDRYGFEDDVMYMLFAYCNKNSALSGNYIQKVAEAWHSKKIKTCFELDVYFNECQKFRDIRGKILKKLKLNRNLTEYEDNIVEKWVSQYKYDFDIIEMALKKTISKINPNFMYLDKILSEWNKKGLKTCDEIAKEIAAFEHSYKDRSNMKPSDKNAAVPQKGNFEQRKYNDEFYNSLYYNTGEASKTSNLNIRSNISDKDNASKVNTLCDTDNTDKASILCNTDNITSEKNADDKNDKK